MKEIRERKRRRRAGWAVFLSALLLVSLAIGLTVLLAQDMRNLKLLMQRFGLDPQKVFAQIESLTTTPAEPPAFPLLEKTARLPAPRVQLPARLMGELNAPEQSFVRRILDPPAGLCEAFDKAGFSPMVWAPSASGLGGLGAAGFECSVIVPVGEPPAPSTAPPARDENGEEIVDDGPQQSSVFVYVHGPRMDAFDTFRIKMNIENPADREAVLALASKAAALFFKQVQWEDAGEIARRILKAEIFDQRDFGSRLQLRKEFGETPRYNFLAAEARRPQARTPYQRFFDREQWLPLARTSPLFETGTVDLRALTGPVPTDTKAR
ncbi:hypothetical protein BTR14_08690 [Rhizobium rhizosphaerae]|uniref:Uncharacterized protein n=1 Tax=Xaviernesmea rhizosphaerae TaxID=1672749 RepID=A0ABX3PEQ1_9HYPH|nr:DUF6030 family protein [Xaviernesmea rhizosphaerae]OQP86994.1 hypothetical protein BTR14_08690 [Xaviernesmea rhizosphaerae]